MNREKLLEFQKYLFEAILLAQTKDSLNYGSRDYPESSYSQGARENSLYLLDEFRRIFKKE